MITQALTLDRTSWHVGNERSYDVWGGVRSGAATGGPKGRYCANLGHVQDDESGLIYMRARYYEPSTGRFISEDPMRDGAIWYVFAANRPTTLGDSSGYSAHQHDPLVGGLMAIGYGGLAMAMIIIKYAADPQSVSLAAGFAATGIAALALAFALGSDRPIGERSIGMVLGFATSLVLARFAADLAAMSAFAAVGEKTLAAGAVSYTYLYGMLLMAELMSQDFWSTLSDGVQFGQMITSTGQ